MPPKKLMKFSSPECIMPSTASGLATKRSTQRRILGGEKCSGLASSVTSSDCFHATNLNGPEPMGVFSWYFSAFSGLVSRSSRIGSQMCLGIRLILASEAVSNGTYGSLRVKRTVNSPVFVSVSMRETKGLYIGDFFAHAGPRRRR